jgi:hypothetical protein
MPCPTSRHLPPIPNTISRSIAQEAAACLGGRGEAGGTATEKMPGGGESLNGEVIHCFATSPRQRGLIAPLEPQLQGRAALKIPAQRLPPLDTDEEACLPLDPAQPSAGWTRDLGRRPPGNVLVWFALARYPPARLPMPTATPPPSEKP